MLKIYSEEEIVELPETDEEPPPPEGGIPKQWLPGWIRWPVRVLLLPFICIDLAAQRFARFLIPPPYKTEGKCLRRGKCCHYILVPEAKGVLGKLFYFWNTQVLGFYQRLPDVYEGEESGKMVLVMGCRYLQKNGACGKYFLRPTVCRKWPIIEHFGRPRIVKGCGFRAVNRR
jgi:hypothetical protein